MGVGIVLFDLSREKREWSAVRRSKHFAIRGGVLLVLARLINVILRNHSTCLSVDRVPPYSRPDD